MAPLTQFDMVAGEACYLLQNLRSIEKIGFLIKKWPSNYPFYCCGGRFTNDRCWERRKGLRMSAYGSFSALDFARSPPALPGSSVGMPEFWALQVLAASAATIL